LSGQKIKTVLFDLDGTLHHQVPRGSDVFANYAQSLGYKVSDEDKVRAEHWTHFYFAYSLEIQNDQKEFTDEKSFWSNFARRRLVALGLPPTDAADLAPEVSAYIADTHKPVSYVPQDAFPVLKALKSKGYIMGMLSNREKPYWEKLIDLNLDSYFKFALASGELNAYKPNKVVFEKALELAETSAAETMYVGDNYFADVVGARRVGITPVLYDPESLFSDTDCAVIKSFDELAELLK